MLSVIVLSYFTGERTVKYIHDLFAASNIEIDVVLVVDNTPNSDNYQIIKNGICAFSAKPTEKNMDGDYGYKINKIEEFDYKNSRIVLVKAAENLVYAKGNNLGFEILQKNYSVEYILISNEDILFKNDYIDFQCLLDDFKADATIGVIGPNVIGLDGKKQTPCDYMSIEERMIFPYLKYPFGRWFKTKHQEIIEQEVSGFVYRLIGAFMLIDADKFRKCGRFDDNIFLYAEEPILSEQMKKRGYHVYYDPRVTVIHEEGLSTVTDSKSILRKEKRLFKSNYYYYKNYIYEKEWKLFLAKILAYIFFFKYKAVHFFIDKNSKEARTK